MKTITDHSIIFARLCPYVSPPEACFLGSIGVNVPNIISISSAVFAGLTFVTNKHTYYATVRVCALNACNVG